MDHSDLIYSSIVLQRSDSICLLSYKQPQEGDPNVLCNPRVHPLLDAAIKALEIGKCLKMTPDQVWITILHGYSQFCQKYPEILMNTGSDTGYNTGTDSSSDSSSTSASASVSASTTFEIVPQDFEFDNPSNDWPSIFPVFCQNIHQQLNRNTPYEMALRYSRSESISVAAAIVDKTTVQYKNTGEIIRAGPGTRSLGITLMGNHQEWGRLRSLVLGLRQGCQVESAREWITEVEQVILGMQNSIYEIESQGTNGERRSLSADNENFWHDFIHVDEDNRVCGHCTVLYPFDSSGNIAWNTPRLLTDFPISGMKYIPFQWIVEEKRSEDSITETCNICAIHAGLLGIAVQDNIVFPVWSWAVTLEKDPETNPETTEGSS